MSHTFERFPPPALLYPPEERELCVNLPDWLTHSCQFRPRVQRANGSFVTMNNSLDEPP
jgi:hypothetical protein